MSRTEILIDFFNEGIADAERGLSPKDADKWFESFRWTKDGDLKARSYYGGYTQRRNVLVDSEGYEV